MNSKTLPFQSIARSVFVFLALLLVGFYFYFGFKGFDIAKIWKIFYQTDFYINYEGGFVRRGLDGQIIFELSKTFSIPGVLVQKIYNLLFFVLFWGCIMYFLLRYKPPFFLVFSTSILLLFVFYLVRGIRKDHILLVFFFFSCLEIIKRRKNTQTLIILNALGIIATLMHELFFIISFFPLVFLLKNLRFKDDNLLGYFKSALMLSPTFIVFLGVCLFGLGSQTQQEAILSSWAQLGVKNIVFNSGIFDRSLYLWELGFTRNQYISFFVAIALHFIFVLIFVSDDLKNKKLKVQFYYLIVLQYLVLFVLSAFAKDFSRWIFLCNFTTIIAIYILKKEVKNFQTEDIIPSFSFFKKVFWLPFILFFINTMPHSGWSFNDYVVYNPLNLVYKISKNKPIF